MALASALPAAAQSGQADKRRKLLEGMGLEKKEAPPAAPAPVPPPSSREAAPEPAEDASARAPGRKPAVKEDRPASPSFRRVVHPALVQGCKACHVAGGPAAATRFVLTGEAPSDHATARRFVNPADAEASALLTKASGQLHGGGGPWPAGSAASTRAAAWIRGGARLDADTAAAAPASSAAPVAAVPGRTTPATNPATRETSVPTPAAEPPLAPEPAPVVDLAAVAAPAPASDDGIHALLKSGCAGCHAPERPAAMTRFVMTGDAAADLASARALVDAGAPERSLLVTKAAGELHGGGALFVPGSAPHQRLVAWAGAAPVPGAPVASPSAETAPPALTTIAPAPLPPPSRHAGASGVGLPYGFQLNGRFDLNYERHQFTGSPAASGAADALRSYHHFLFLSRQDAKDRLGLNVEMLGLLFWEARVRLSPANRPWQLAVAGGKILVPFGADPLFHQSYGGSAGFDQRMLPAIWAQEGAAAHLVVQRRELAITDDLFVIRGYALRRGDGVLNLRSDFSPDDNAQIAIGNRIGASWGPLSVWYSALYNPLGFGRRLFMQAADVTLWRMRHVPVLEYLSFGAGAMRADVSGGGSDGFGGGGRDYYHFGTYVQLRVHPCDWLYIQYRQGLRTFDNRRGTIVDRTRLTSEDGSTHNFGVVARRRGVSAGVFYFVNLEKANEVPNDLLRVSVAYDF